MKSISGIKYKYLTANSLLLLHLIISIHKKNGIIKVQSCRKAIQLTGYFRSQVKILMIPGNEILHFVKC
jgi:hypothetical protein